MGLITVILLICLLYIIQNYVNGMQESHEARVKDLKSDVEFWRKMYDQVKNK